MTVTVVCDVLGEENNGTTIAAMNLIRSLRAKGHTVRVVCSDQNRDGEAGFYVVPTRNLGPFNGYIAKNGVSLAKVDTYVLQQAIDGADVVHILVPFSLGSAAVKIARERSIPITASFHCQAENFTNHIFLMNSRAANNLTYQYFYHKVYQYCTCVHYPSQFICDVFEKATKPTNHYIISNGVNAMYRPGPAACRPEWNGKFVILFTGRYSREKSHKVLIEAVAKSRYRDQIQLVFAGAGPQKENLINLSREKLTVQPVFGFYSRKELIEIINAADLYVHPAEIEIEAIACLEAIACGKVPVIADSPRSATRYFALTKQNLFHYNDPADLAQKIDYWIEHPKKREECSKQYLGFASQFDFDRCMDRMEQMLKDAVESSAHA